MASENGSSDWRERMEQMERDIKATHESILEQGRDISNLLDAIRKLIDRIPPENLR